VLVNSLLALIFTTSYFDAELVEYSWFSYKSFGIYVKTMRKELGFSTIENEELSLIHLIAISISLILKTSKWILVEMICSFTGLVTFASCVICKELHTLMTDSGENDTLVRRNKYVLNFRCESYF